MADDFGLGSEVGVHGRRWHALHDGYFTNPEVALSFLNIISREILNCTPNVVADLGGGTGFVLSEIARRHPAASIKYVDVDISAIQLGECKDNAVSSLQVSAADITREALVDNDGSLMFIMRSLLHYLGHDGLAPFLKHLRAQMKPGEIMIHQTACFEFYEEADCANHLYTLMRTHKWYPMVSSLTRTLNETGWEVVDCKPAHDLCLRSAELVKRYNLSAADVTRIREEMIQKYNEPTVFVPIGSNFNAFLQYRIFTCKAGL